MLAVAQPHDHPVGGPGRDLEHRGQPLGSDDQGVVAGRLQRVGQALEAALAVVVDLRRLAVHDGRRPDHPPPEDLPDALVAEADAEDRHPPGEAEDHLVGDAGVLRPARARRDEDGVGGEGLDAVEGEGVVAVHDRLGAELPEVLDQVVDERVVVVDHQHAGAHRGEANGALPAPILLSRWPHAAPAGPPTAGRPVDRRHPAGTLGPVGSRPRAPRRPVAGHPRRAATPRRSPASRRSAPGGCRS